MILLDKTKASATIILTLSESSDAEEFDIQLHSAFTNKDYTIELGEDQSAYPSRFNEYILAASVYNDIEAGRFSFSIVERGTDTVVERGVLQVVGEPEEEPITLEPEATEDDFITMDLD